MSPSAMADRERRLLEKSRSQSVIDVQMSMVSKLSYSEAVEFLKDYLAARIVETRAEVERVNALTKGEARQ